MAAPHQRVWPEGRPALADTKDWSCHGSLGWTLQQALNEMDEMQTAAGAADPPQQSPDETGSDPAAPDDDNSAQTGEVDPPSKPISTLHIHATPELRQAVLAALATGCGDTRRTKRTTATTSPHGVLKGRIRYYQRQGSRWRMEVDNVRIRRRFPLAKIRRKAERPSFWDLSRELRRREYGNPSQASTVDEDAEKQSAEAQETTKWSFELLAYNDNE